MTSNIGQLIDQSMAQHNNKNPIIDFHANLKGLRCQTVERKAYSFAMQFFADSRYNDV